MEIVFKSLPYRPFRLTSPFIDRNSSMRRTNLPLGATTYHDGIDCGRDRSKYPDAYSNAPAGDVYAVMDGIVIERGYKKGRGNTVLVKHEFADKSVVTLYQHLANQGASEGTIVVAGDTIGQMGRTGMGKDMAIHLHFEIRIDGKCVDPLPYIQAVTYSSCATQKELQTIATKMRKKYNFSNETTLYIMRYRDPIKICNTLYEATNLTDEELAYIKKYKYSEALLERVYGEKDG